jgi:Ca2+-transporting ATPase
MRIGMVVQTIAITGATLGGFFLGLSQGGVSEGRSVAFTVLTASELLRAYTTRSERFSIFKIGLFTNKWMQIAVGASIVLLLGVIYIPFLNPIFETKPLTLIDWYEIIPLVLLPSVAAELTKFVLRRVAPRAISPAPSGA